MPIEHDRDGDVHGIRPREGENTIDVGFVERMRAVDNHGKAENSGASSPVRTGEPGLLRSGLALRTPPVGDALRLVG